MPVPFEGPPSELDGLAMFLDEQRAAILRKLDGLTEEEATSHPTASATTAASASKPTSTSGGRGGRNCKLKAAKGILKRWC